MKSTIADKIIGTILILGGICVGIGTVAGPAIVEWAKSVNPNQPSMPAVGPAEMAVGAVTSVLVLLGGIGMWLAARWGHMLVILACAIGVVHAVWGIVNPTLGVQGIVGGVCWLVVYFALGGYCLWRVTSNKGQA